jgi:hypothetical protein
MPTTITIPIAERTKSVQYGATYSSALTFNPDKALLVGCSAVLAGMGVTVNTGPVPAEATVAIGSFIQNGIIINVTSAQTLQFPAAPIAIPLYLVAENDNETYNSSVQFLFTTAPAADSVIIAEWLTGIETDFQMPIGVSNCALRDAISGVQMLIIQRDRQAAIAGQTVFTLAPGKSYVLGANKIWVYRNGKKLDVSNDYVETSTTSITIFMPAISGDIFEFMIFKGAPPITSIALDDLTDVTTDLANAIKDVSVLRSGPATASNPLATLADISVLKQFRYVGHERFPSGTFSSGSLATVPTLPAGYLEVYVPTGRTYKIVILGFAYMVECWRGGAGHGLFQISQQIPPGPEVDYACSEYQSGCGEPFVLYWPQSFFFEAQIGSGPVTVRYRMRFKSSDGGATLYAPSYIMAMTQDL